MPIGLATQERATTRHQDHNATVMKALHDAILSCAELMISPSFLTLNRLAAETGPDSFNARQCIKAALQSIRDMTITLLDTAQTEGLLIIPSPEEAAEHLIALLQGRTSHLLVFIGEDISANSIRAEVETITRMFLHAYRGARITARS